MEVNCSVVGSLLIFFNSVVWLVSLMSVAVFLAASNISLHVTRGT